MQQPVHLKTPHNDLVLVRFTERSEKNPLVTYRLWRKPEPTAGAGPTVLELLAPSDEDAEQLVEAWYNRARFSISPWRYAWYQKVLERAEELRIQWQRLPGNADSTEMDRALDEYLAADHFEKLLMSAFAGRWPADPNRDALV